MGTRALEFSRAHPDESPGYTAALAQLEEQLARSQQLAGQQRQGVVEVRAGGRMKGNKPSEANRVIPSAARNR